jgi:phage shock protein PspC (stress-responsive transcriptional regulator)
MSTADEIAKLHDLLGKGAITQAEFEQAKARLLGGGTAGTGDWSVNSLRLSNDDRWIAGVCGGIAQTTAVESWIWRLIMVVGLFAGGVTLVLYLLLWIFIPRAAHRT